ncbi:hypothetical protein P261_01760 [Lachnospiraceae bacterium TWA4]|nr:hypothetical protein P261_01760 [Lachnospiraceae bacterium TWA4]
MKNTLTKSLEAYENYIKRLEEEIDIQAKLIDVQEEMIKQLQAANEEYSKLIEQCTKLSKEN